MRLTNLWVRKPRPEIAIREGLKGLSAKSVLYNYYHFPARHVLITPQGVFAIVTRWQDGNYSVEGDAWKTHQGGFSRLLRIFRYDGLGNPNQDAVRAVARVRKHLEPIAPEVEVQPLIIFVDPRATLEVNDPIIPAVYADSKQKPNLKDYLRAFSRETEETEANGSKSKKRNQQKSVKENPMPLTPEQIEAFEAASIGR